MEEPYIFKDKKISSMVTANPLLAGFIVSLASSGVDITQYNQTEIYKEIIKCACIQQPEIRESVEFDRRNAKTVLSIIGWNLIGKEYLVEDDLVDELVRELQTAGYSLEVAEERAKQGIQFWKDQQILNSLTFGYESIIEFSHLSLCE